MMQRAEGAIGAAHDPDRADIERLPGGTGALCVNVRETLDPFEFSVEGEMAVMHAQG